MRVGNELFLPVVASACVWESGQRACVAVVNEDVVLEEESACENASFLVAEEIAVF